MAKKVITATNAQYYMPQIGQAVRDMLRFGKDVVIEFKEFKAKRSLAQNRLMWVWNQEIAEHMREHFGQENSSEDVHEVFVRKKFGVRVIQAGNEEPIIVRKRTRKLNTKEFTEYLNWLEQYCAEYLELMLTRPDDLYMLALYGETNVAN
ncbi:recombination protein NinB [Pseudoalteromonas lipolytica]|uniref:recombination protein NinB n=1 Tax=Pseudoalteromonas lipolytica TaxID=570156 RepID=UPI000C4D5B83|nr:recombination protein NinB [Pseudoalteromonas lipolytica]MAE02312.1 hypothetical protein [Pseudoalteromonas sp.]